MLLLEINEFNVPLISEIADRLRLKTLQDVLHWRHTATLTADTYDSGLLEPWVQWASIHTGVPSGVHGIRNLGETPSENYRQIWEQWSAAGYDSIVWGVMNGSRRHAERCRAFVPDPWTFTEDAHPSELNSLISLPRYLAKNYLSISKLKTAKSALSFFRSLLGCVDRKDLYDALKVLMSGLRKFGVKHHVFIVFFEYVSAMAFLQAVRRHNPDHAIIFVNMLAHTQHHYWGESNAQSNSELDHATSAIDDILRKIVTAQRSKDNIFVMNGLSQVNTCKEPPWVLHRPIDPLRFVNHLGIRPTRIEPLMTHDAHLIFDSTNHRDAAFETLRQIVINEAPMLYVEKGREDSRKLFYRLDFFEPVDDQTTFCSGNTVERFKDHFVSIVTRTGKHVQTGSILSNCHDMPKEMANHEMYQVLLNEPTDCG